MRALASRTRDQKIKVAQLFPGRARTLNLQPKNHKSGDGARTDVRARVFQLLRCTHAQREFFIFFSKKVSGPFWDFSQNGELGEKCRFCPNWEKSADPAQTGKKVSIWPLAKLAL
jgi:hypothetical protein